MQPKKVFRLARVEDYENLNCHIHSADPLQSTSVPKNRIHISMTWILIEAALALLLLIGLVIWSLRDAWAPDSNSNELLEESTKQNEESPHRTPHRPH